MCFFPETHPRNLDIRQRAENTNITSPPSSTSSSVCCDPSSAITASLCFAVLCVCAVC